MLSNTEGDKNKISSGCTRLHVCVLSRCAGQQWGVQLVCLCKVKLCQVEYSQDVRTVSAHHFVLQKYPRNSEFAFQRQDCKQDESCSKDTMASC